MTPEQLLKFTLVTLVILAIIFLASFLLLSVLKKGKNKRPESSNSTMPQTPLELLENLIFLNASHDSASGQIYQDQWTTYVRFFQKQSDFDMLGLLHAYTNVIEERTSSSFEKLCELLRILHDKDNLNSYLHFYSNLTIFLNAVERANADFGILPDESKVVPTFQAITSSSAQQRALRRLLQELISVFPDIHRTSDMLSSISTDSMSDEKFSVLNRLRNNLLDFLQGRAASTDYLLKIETQVLIESIEFFLERIANVAKNYSVTDNDQEESEPVFELRPTKFRVTKGREVHIQFNITNISSVLRDDAFIQVHVSPEDEIDTEESRKITLGSFHPEQSKPYGIKIKPHSSKNHTRLQVEVGYRRSTGRPISNQLPLVIHLEEPELLFQKAPYQTAPKNRKIDNFVGRKNMIKRIVKAINLEDSGQIIGLFGLARIGKTALLFEMMNGSDVSNNIIFVYFSLDEHSFMSKDWFESILSSIFERIQEDIALARLHLPKVGESRSLALKIVKLFDKLQAELRRKNKQLVLVIDEFHRIEEATTPSQRDAKKVLISFFKQIAVNVPRVSLILSGYHDIPTLSRYDNFWMETLGKGFDSLKLSFLNKVETLELIVEPMASLGIRYEKGVPEQIYELTRGYPWYIQLICNNLFESIAEEQISTISEKHLTNVIEDILVGDQGHVYFRHLFAAAWAGPLTEAVVQIIAKAPENQRDIEAGLKYVSRSCLHKKLQSLGIKIELGTLHTRMESMTRKDVLITREIDDESYSAIAIPLLEQWHARTGDIQATLSSIESK